MKYIIISIMMIFIGLIGILKTKFPTFRGNPGFAAKIRLYFTFYALFFLGIIFLILEIKEKIR